MEKYSVKEIAELLGTNPETVRRWIRENKLAASQDSRKEGNTVTLTELQKFLEANSKYAGIAASSVTKTPYVGSSVPVAVSAAMAAMALPFCLDLLKKEKNSQTYSQDALLTLIREEIKKKQDSINEKRKTVSEIKKEIDEEEKQVRNLKTAEKAILDKIEKAEDGTENGQ